MNHLKYVDKVVWLTKHIGNDWHTFYYLTDYPGSFPTPHEAVTNAMNIDCSKRQPAITHIKGADGKLYELSGNSHNCGES